MKQIIYTVFLTGTLLGGLSQANAVSHFQSAHFYQVHNAAVAHITAGVPIHPSVVDHDHVRVFHPEAYTSDLSGGRRLGCTGINGC